MKTKMKQLLRIGVCMSFILLFKNAQAQDVAINITPQTVPMLYHAGGLLRVSICNTNPTPVSAPANKLRPLISFPDNLKILGAFNTDGTPITNFNVESLTDVPGDHTIRLLYTTTLANFDCVEFDVLVRGEEVGEGGPITCTLSFNGPMTVGNSPANDNSVAEMPVDVNLPVKLKTFNVSKEGKLAVINWVTTEEVNSERFDVQRSEDGKTWEIIESVEALGNSEDGKTYTSFDANPFIGENLYRLHMIDKDGTSAYSAIRNLEFEGAVQFVYPNPASEKLMLNKSIRSGIASVEIFDANGKEIYKIKSNPEEIDVSRFKAGVYVVRVKSIDGKETSSKILVVK
ncbi:T9SS type A sorting domain-containing protein [Dyadobacter aurulentus]|uniref:T9SS type A sorting domain-containing protein n=1 Tax=Dyadobacter sp. UC 10 TaxID=2605428 RepID=UPI0011F2464B|nr:T9SS type A sorting domain-containing protein [Dyadobacter sp. UC 10]KAA0993802.1 T9SS type A sorting domain-containing protein [Dyadobacter sp. UC 10]